MARINQIIIIIAVPLILSSILDICNHIKINHQYKLKLTDFTFLFWWGRGLSGHQDHPVSQSILQPSLTILLILQHTAQLYLPISVSVFPRAFCLPDFVLVPFLVESFGSSLHGLSILFCLSLPFSIVSTTSFSLYIYYNSLFFIFFHSHVIISYFIEPKIFHSIFFLVSRIYFHLISLVSRFSIRLI